jgi:hypothetical protein
VKTFKTILLLRHGQYSDRRAKTNLNQPANMTIDQHVERFYNCHHVSLKKMNATKQPILLNKYKTTPKRYELTTDGNCLQADIIRSSVFRTA